MSSNWLTYGLSYSATLQALADLEGSERPEREIPVITNCNNHNWVRGIRQIRVHMQMGEKTQKPV